MCLCVYLAGGGGVVMRSVNVRVCGGRDAVSKCVCVGRGA